MTKANENQYNDVSNQSQIFFVNMPTTQEPKNQQQVLSVLTTDQQPQTQTQQQVLPVTVVQQGMCFYQSFSYSRSISHLVESVCSETSDGCTETKENFT